MTKIQMLMKVLEHLKFSDGWYCYNITNTKVMMRHPVHGKRVYIVLNGSPIVIRKTG